MGLSTSELTQRLPPFAEVTAGDRLLVNNTTFDIAGTRTEHPGPGEVVRYLELADSDGEQYLLSFVEGHTVETVYYHPIDDDPMDGDLVAVDELEYVSG